MDRGLASGALNWDALYTAHDKAIDRASRDAHNKKTTPRPRRGTNRALRNKQIQQLRRVARPADLAELLPTERRARDHRTKRAQQASLDDEDAGDRGGIEADCGWRPFLPTFGGRQAAPWPSCQCAALDPANGISERPRAITEARRSSSNWAERLGRPGGEIVAKAMGKPGCPQNWT